MITKQLNISLIIHQAEVKVDDKIKLQFAFYRNNKINKGNPLKFHGPIDILKIQQQFLFNTTIEQQNNTYKNKQINLQMACEIDGTRHIFQAKFNLKQHVGSNKKNKLLNLNDIPKVKVLYTLNVQITKEENLEKNGRINLVQRQNFHNNNNKVENSLQKKIKFQLKKQEQYSDDSISKSKYLSKSLKKKNQSQLENKLQQKGSKSNKAKIQVKEKQQQQNFEKYKINQEQNSKLIQKLKITKDQLIKTTEQNSLYQKQKQQFLNKIKKLNQTINKLNQNISKLHLEKSNLQQINKSLTLSNKQIQKQQKQLKIQISSSKQNQIGQNNLKSIKKLSQKLKKSQDSSNYYKEKCQSLTKQLQITTQVFQDLKKKTILLEQKNIFLANSLAEYQQKLDKTTIDLQTAKQQIKNLTLKYKNEHMLVNAQSKQSDQNQIKTLTEKFNKQKFQKQKIQRQLVQKQKLIKVLTDCKNQIQRQKSQQIQIVRNQLNSLRQQINNGSKLSKEDNDLSLQYKVALEKLKKQTQTLKKNQRNLMLDKAQIDNRNKQLQDQVIKVKGNVASLLNAIHENTSLQVAELILNSIQY